MRTRNALEILKRRAARDSELREGYEQEKINFKVAILIREEREKAGLSQTQLADLIGTTQSVISRLEDADYEGHSLNMLSRIVQALNRKLEITVLPCDPPYPLSKNEAQSLP